MPKLKLSEKELADILADYNNGMSMGNVAKKYHHNARTLKRYFLENNIHVRNMTEALEASKKKEEGDLKKRKYYVNDSFFSEQNSEMAYLLGFLMADGNVSKKGNRVQIALSAIDKDFLVQVQEKIGGSQVVDFIVNNKPYVRWECMSSKIKKDLIEYDVIPRKTGFEKIPKKLNEEYYPDFIRGFFDGDGSIYEDNAVGLNFTSHSKEILQNILGAFEKMGVPPVTLHDDTSHPGNYYIRYRTKAALKVYEIFYKGENCFKLQRKYDKFTQIVQKKKGSKRLRT